MKKIFITLFALISSICLFAQNLSQFKEVPSYGQETTPSFIDGNKYQKDAILFVNMLKDTHPYYITAERQDLLLSKLDNLLIQCKNCTSDKEFVKLLQDVMPEVRDKHTDVLDMDTYAQQKSSKNTVKDDVDAETTKDNIASPLVKSNELFNYTIFKKESICYLQFNQCNDARTLKDESMPRFDEMLDEMFMEIAKKKILTLIVDVQYNNGGSSRLCDELIDRIYPYSNVKNLDTYMRFSKLMALYSPKTESAMNAWNKAGHQNELYYMPEKKVQAPEHEVFNGEVVFIQGEKTFSSAGILITLARDNGIGTIIGTESTFSPSHYGEVLPFILPNTGVLGSVCTKYFERPDKSVAEAKTLTPDTCIDLSDKENAWKEILKMYSK